MPVMSHNRISYTEDLTQVVFSYELYDTSLWQTLMYWKTMFDRCYCIISTKYSVTFAIKMWPESINRFKMAAIVRFDLDVPEKGPF